MRGAGLGVLAILAACTAPAPEPQPAPPILPPPAASPPELEPEPSTPPQPGMELPPPPSGVLVVTGEPPAADEHIDEILPLGGARALLRRGGPGGTSLSLTTSPEGQVWRTATPYLSGFTVVDDTVVFAALGDRYPAALALDLASGAQLWQTTAPHAELSKDRQHISLAAGAGQVLHLLHDGPDHPRILQATRARDGEVLGVVSGWIEPVVTPRWVAVSETHARGGHAYTLRPRQDLTAARSLGALRGVCIVDDRLYATRDFQLVRLDLTDLDRPEVRVLPGRATTLERCDRHGDADILWIDDRVVSVDRSGAVTWALGLSGLGFTMDHELGADLGRWHQPASAALPDHAVRLVRRDDKLSLLLVDLRRHRAREARLAAFWGGTLVHAGAHHVLLLRPSDRHTRMRNTEVLISIDGATGLVGAAVLVDDDYVELVSASDEFVWLYTEDRRMRLDAATLRPSDPGPAFTLHAVDEWARALDTAPAAAPPLPRVIPPIPPRPSPRRTASPAPPWDTGELLAAARVAARVPASGTAVSLLMWDRQEEDDGGWAEHALLVLEHAGASATHTAVLMRRSNRDVWAPWWEIENSDGSANGHPLDLESRSVGVWGVLRRPHADAAIEVFDHRPTTADLRFFLERCDPWDPAGNYIGFNPKDPYTRACLVDGNNIDAAWRELTGEAPPLAYPPEIERPD